MLHLIMILCLGTPTFSTIWFIPAAHTPFTPSLTALRYVLPFDCWDELGECCKECDFRKSSSFKLSDGQVKKKNNKEEEQKSDRKRGRVKLM